MILIDFDDRTSRRPDVRSFPPSAIRTANFSAEKHFGRKILGRIFFGRKTFARIFSWGGLGGRSRSFHFKKFAKANFLKWCRGGVWGVLLPQESPLPVPCPPGGSGGLRPPGISVNYPCLASAAAVPCPRALPPNLFSSEFFRRNFFVRIFSSEFFRPNFFRPIFSSVRRPSVRRPSVRRSLPPMLNCKNDCFYRGVKFRRAIWSALTGVLQTLIRNKSQP